MRKKSKQKKKSLTNKAYILYRARKLAQNKGIPIATAESIIRQQQGGTEKSKEKRKALNKAADRAIDKIMKKSNIKKKQAIKRYYSEKTQPKIVSGGAPGLGKKKS